MTGKQTALPDSIEIVKCRSNRNADSIEILYPRSHARPARSRSLAPLAPSYLSLTLARLLARSPLRHLPPLAHCRFCNTVLARIRFGSHNTVLARIRFSSYNTVLALINTVLAGIRCSSYNTFCRGSVVALPTPCWRGSVFALTTPFWRESVLAFATPFWVVRCLFGTYHFTNFGFLDSQKFYPLQIDRSRSYPHSHARPARSRTCPCSRMCLFILNFRSLTVCT